MKSSLITSVCAGALCITSAVHAEEVRIYNWNDYIDDAVIEAFEQETGINVIYDVFDDNSILEAKLLAGSSGYDVVVPSGYYLARQIGAGLFLELDQSQLPNLFNMSQPIMDQTANYDPGNAHSINYMWGTTGLGYNVSEVAARVPDADTNSWSLLFDPQNAAALSECGITILDSPDTMLPTALNYLGLDPQSTYTDDLEAAADVIRAIQPYIRRFDGTEYVSALANGDLCLAVGYSGVVFQAQYRAVEAGNGVEVAYVIPNEGAQIWFDQLAIPADAPNPENAHAFLNFIMRPGVAAQLTNYVQYANGNAAATDLISADVRENPAIYPSDDVLANLFTTAVYSARDTRTMTRLWADIRRGE